MDDPQAPPEPSDLDPLLVAAQRMDLLARLAPGIAHELANPLAAVMSYGSMIRTDDRLPDDVRADAEAMHRSAELAHQRIKGLLDFARHRPPERQTTSVDPLVQAVVALLTYQLTSRSIRLDVGLAPALPAVTIDRPLVQQALLNLMANALEALDPGGGRIRIDARASLDGTSRVLLTVTDDGPGVDAAVADRIFEPFVTTRGPGRLGLGLAVSRAIVEAHAGTLDHHPGEGGRGASFVAALPVGAATGDDAVATPGHPPAPVPEAPPPPNSSHTESPRPGRVLVVDDDPSLRTYLSRALAGIGVDVVEASTADEAIEAVRTGAGQPDRAVDLVISDVRMPGAAGTDLYEAVTAIRPDLARRFALMSGDVGEPSLRRFADARGIRLLAKPFDLAEIRTTVRDLLDGG